MKQKEYTRGDVIEIAHCHDAAYFVEKYAIGKKLTKNQLGWLTSTDQRISLGDERRSYRTTTMLARAVHECFFKSEQTIAFVSHSLISLTDANSIVRKMIENSGRISPPITYLNRSSIEFENYSCIRFMVASGHAFRGLTTSIAMIDNISVMKPNVYDELLENLLPCIATGGKLMESF